MKHINIIFIALSLVMLVLVGCSDNNNITQPDDLSAIKLVDNKPATSVKDLGPEKPEEFPIIADKEIYAGTVSVVYNHGNLYATFRTIKGWNLKETYLQVANHIKEIPVNKDGFPTLEKFAYMSMHRSGMSEYTYMIPTDRYGFRRGQDVVFVAHTVLAEAIKPTEKAMLMRGWAGKEAGPGPNWWNYFTYTIKGIVDPGGGIEFDQGVVLDRQYISNLQ